MVERPAADRVAATTQDRDVESIDLRREQHLRFVGGSPRRGRGRLEDWRCDLAGEALQRPVAAAFDLRRHARQRDDRADLFTDAGELEARDVALHTVVVRGERRRAHELDRPVLAHETAARGCRCREHPQCEGDQHPEPEPSSTHVEPPKSMARTRVRRATDFDGATSAPVPDVGGASGIQQGTRR